MFGTGVLPALIVETILSETSVPIQDTPWAAKFAIVENPM
jgi:hypothetical protein